MSDTMRVTPEELLAQSVEMEGLKAEYERLFSQVQKNLREMNDEWSTGLANNLTGKIDLTVNGCNSIIEILDMGCKVSRTSAQEYMDVEEALKKLYGDGGLKAEAQASPVSDEGAFSSEEQEAFYQKLHDYLLQYMDEESAKSVLERYSDYAGLMEGSFWDDVFPEGYQWAAEWAKKYWKKGFKAIVGKEETILFDLLKDLSSGDPLKAGKKFFKAVGKAGDFEGNLEVKLIVNAVFDGIDAYVDYAKDPSVFNLLKIGWNSTLGAAAETVGETAWGIVKYIPGISSYYEKNGVKDFGDAFSKMYEDWIYAFTDDSDFAKQCANYYADNGGLFQGLWNGWKEIGKAGIETIKENGLINVWKKGWTAEKEFVGNFVDDWLDGWKIMFGKK